MSSNFSGKLHLLVRIVRVRQHWVSSFEFCAEEHELNFINYPRLCTRECMYKMRESSLFRIVMDDCRQIIIMFACVSCIDTYVRYSNGVAKNVYQVEISQNKHNKSSNHPLFIRRDNGSTDNSYRVSAWLNLLIFTKVFCSRPFLLMRVILGKFPITNVQIYKCFWEPENLIKEWATVPIYTRGELTHT